MRLFAIKSSELAFIERCTFVCGCPAYGPAVGDPAKKDAEAAKAKFMDGSLAIYRGELKDNAGKVLLTSGKEFAQKANELEAMNWLVEGVIGKTA